MIQVLALIVLSCMPSDHALHGSFNVAAGRTMFAAELSVDQHRVPSKRSRVLLQRFKRLTGYPHGRPGFKIDHVIPLCAGGPDAIENLQWQDNKTSYVKDVFERNLCAAMRRQGYRLVKQEQK